MEAAYQGECDLTELVDTSEQKIFAVAERNLTTGFTRLQDLVKEQFLSIQDNRISGLAGTGLNTDFSELDSITAGLQPSDLIILAARPSMGKTALALNIARNVALSQQEQNTVAVFSLEMAKEQLALRLLCSEARVTQDNVRHAMLSDDDMQRLAEGVDRLWHCPLYIDDTPGASVLEIRGKARRLKAEQGLGLIVIDYLQLMNSHVRAENRVQEIAQIARGLKGLARELKVPVIALSQLSRMVEQRSPRRPQLSDLRESGAIEQDADLVMFLYRPAYYGDEEIIRACVENPSERKDLENMPPEQRQAALDSMRNTTFLIVAKQRNGPTGNVRLLWVKEHGIFGDIEHR